MALSPDMVLLVAALAGAGFLSGLIAGLLGVGGGIVLVPVLYQTFVFFDLPAYLQMHMAVGTSLAIICFTGAQSARSHFKRDAVELTKLKSWGGFIIAGALVGAIASRFIAPSVLKLVFAALSLGLGVRMLARGQNTEAAKLSPLPVFWQKSGALNIGFFSALMGIGGGTFSVPLLGRSGLDIHKAVGTSAALGVFVAIPATLGFMLAGQGLPELPALSVGYVNMLALLLMIPASMLGAPLGVRLAHRLSETTLHFIFAGFLLLSGGRMALALFS